MADWLAYLLQAMDISELPGQQLYALQADVEVEAEGERDGGRKNRETYGGDEWVEGG